MKHLLFLQDLIWSERGGWRWLHAVRTGHSDLSVRYRGIFQIELSTQLLLLCWMFPLKICGYFKKHSSEIENRIIYVFYWKIVQILRRKIETSTLQLLVNERFSPKQIRFGSLDENSKLFTSCTGVIFVMANCKGNHHCAWRRTANAAPEGHHKITSKMASKFQMASRHWS